MAKIASRRSFPVSGRSFHAPLRQTGDHVVLAGRMSKVSRKQFGLPRKTMAVSPEERRLDAELDALDVRLSRLREKVERLRMRFRDLEIHQG